MKKFLVLFLTIVLFSSIYALTEADIVFPVSELGDCSSEQECKVHCDQNENIEACLDFAETYNLISSGEIAEARQVIEFIKSGDTPGGCVSKTECDAYCDKEENLQECVDFAVQAGFISEEEAQMAIKTGGKGPGGCKREECKEFCEKDENIMTCIEFAYEHGMMNEEEYEMVKKTGGKGPGDCKGKEECEAYCEDPANMKTCMEFAMEYGLMPEGEMERIQNMNEGEKCMMDCIMDSGINPDSCGGPDGGEPSAECQPCVEQCMHLFDHGPRDGEMGPGSHEGMMPPECEGLSQEECRNLMEQSGMMSPEGHEGMGQPEGYEGMMPPEGYEGEMMEPPPENYEEYNPPEEYSEPPQEEYSVEPIEESPPESEGGEAPITGEVIKGETSNGLFSKIAEFFKKVFS